MFLDCSVHALTKALVCCPTASVDHDCLGTAFLQLPFFVAQKCLPVTYTKRLLVPPLAGQRQAKANGWAASDSAQLLASCPAAERQTRAAGCLKPRFQGGLNSARRPARSHHNGRAQGSDRLFKFSIACRVRIFSWSSDARAGPAGAVGQAAGACALS